MNTITRFLAWLEVKLISTALRVHKRQGGEQPEITCATPPEHLITKPPIT